MQKLLINSHNYRRGDEREKEGEGERGKGEGEGEEEEKQHVAFI